MFEIGDSLLYTILYVIAPVVLRSMAWLWLLMVASELFLIGEGYSHLQKASLYACLSALCFCYQIGYDAGVASGCDGWTIGMVWVIISSIITYFILCLGCPTFVMALILWGFILIGPGEMVMQGA